MMFSVLSLTSCTLRYILFQIKQQNTVSTVVRANLCISRLLKVKGKGIRNVGGAPEKNAYTVRTTNIISQP